MFISFAKTTDGILMIDIPNDVIRDEYVNVRIQNIPSPDKMFLISMTFHWLRKPDVGNSSHNI